MNQKSSQTWVRPSRSQRATIAALLLGGAVLCGLASAGEAQAQDIASFEKRTTAERSPSTT
jgi:hypothetical protein